MLRDTTSIAVQRGLEGAARRQEAIAANIANAETPGYRPQRVAFEQSLRAAIERERSSTPGTMRSHAVDGVRPHVSHQPVLTSHPATIELEREMSDLAKTSLHYDALTRVLSKRLGMLRTAITGGA